MPADVALLAETRENDLDASGTLADDSGAQSPRRVKQAAEEAAAAQKAAASVNAAEEEAIRVKAPNEEKASSAPADSHSSVSPIAASSASATTASSRVKEEKVAAAYPSGLPPAWQASLTAIEDFPTGFLGTQMDGGWFAEHSEFGPVFVKHFKHSPDNERVNVTEPSR